MKREETINRILTAARKPCPEIVPSNKLLCSDGVYRSPFGIPRGVATTDQVKTVGYVYRDRRNGTTFGTLHESEQSARDKWNDCQDRQMDEFRTILENATEEEMLSQSSYWLHQ